jgi:hypothetical protein
MRKTLLKKTFKKGLTSLDTPVILDSWEAIQPPSHIGDKQMVIENASGWYIEVSHGSGPGRSYGVATAFFAEGEANQYYDGSDYQ